VAKARLVIDASGRGARFARRAGANIRAFDQLVAVSFVLKPEEGDFDRCVIVESGPDGWLFSTLEPSGHRIITFFTDVDIWSKIAPSCVGGIFGPVLAGSEIVSRYARNDRVVQRCRWPAATLALDHAYRGGILAVGDAALTRDPLSSQGIAAAMEDAEAAASLVVANFGGDLEGALRSHEDRSWPKIVDYLRARCLYYRSEGRWIDRPFWSRRHEIRRPNLMMGAGGTSRQAAALNADDF
jgi:flavin-dependent dehydrogenase